MKIPFLNLEPTHKAIRTEMQKAFESVYDSNWFILGNQLEQFEEAYAEYNGVSHAIGVSNGLDALVLGLKALEIGPGDEVIVPAHTYIATALAISHVGAIPVLAESDLNTYNIDPEAIKKVITPETKAIIPVHLYGQACEMDRIIEIARDHDLYVIEDNAQAHGSHFKGRATGSWGDVTGISFYPGKNLGALGDGGMVVTNNPKIAERVRILRNYGSKKKYYHEMQGYNMRLDELQAAFLQIKLKKLPEWTQERQQIANWYGEELNDIPGIILPKTHPLAGHVYHLYVIRSKKRDTLQKHLLEHNIDTLIHYPIPLHLQPAYYHLGKPMGSFPVTEELANTSLSLPLWVGMKKQSVKLVSSVIKDFFN
jgi:dTDP-4-amino-4,6-dideoxygalactose transaminase